MEPILITKMATKTVGARPKNVAEDGTPLRLYTVFGKVYGIKTGDDLNGKVWSALVGTFAAQNIATGQEYRSGKLFLPGGIHELLESKAMELKDGESITFGMEIRAVFATNPQGYSYQAVNLLPVERQDEFTEIRRQISAAQAPKTEAPEPEAPKTENTAPETPKTEQHTGGRRR